jgi:hypothetical protein
MSHPHPLVEEITERGYWHLNRCHRCLPPSKECDEARLLREALSYIEALAGASEWQPIETAPKMRTILLFAVTDVTEEGTVRNWKMATGSWLTGYEDEQSKARHLTSWQWDGRQLKVYDHQPTHWMPLPPLPAVGEARTRADKP